MRILFERPVSSDRFDGLVSRKDGIHDVLRSQVEHTISSLIVGPGRIFVPEDFSLESDAIIELINIFQQGMELYVQLQTQFVQLMCMDPLESPLGNSTFDEHSMKEHFIQRKKVSSGMPVELIVCPAVYFLGNEDGEGYHREKLLLKPTVWVNSNSNEEPDGFVSVENPVTPERPQSDEALEYSNNIEYVNEENMRRIEQMQLD